MRYSKAGGRRTGRRGYQARRCLLNLGRFILTNQFTAIILRRLNLSRHGSSSRNQRKSQRMLVATRIVCVVTEERQERH